MASDLPSDSTNTASTDPSKPLFGNWSPSDIKFDFHGFMSTGMSTTSTASDYNMVGYGNINNSADFYTPTLLGIQLKAEITPKISIVTQVVADGDRSTGQSAYQPNVNWLYASYKFNDNLSVRAGRFQLPSFLYSEGIRIGYNFPYTYLPNEVYRILPVYSINGVNLLYTHTIADSGWAFSVEPLFGNTDWDYHVVAQGGGSTAPLNTTPTSINASFSGKNFLGADVQLYNNAFKFNASYLRGDVSTEFMPNTSLSFSGQYVSLGANYDQNNIWLSAEYAERFVDAPIAALRGYYLSGGYHIQKFLPYISFAQIKTTNASDLNKPQDEVIQDQHSFTLGLNYYVNTHMVIKSAYSYIVPENNSYGLFATKPSGNVSMFTLSTSLVF